MLLLRKKHCGEIAEIRYDCQHALFLLELEPGPCIICWSEKFLDPRICCPYLSGFEKLCELFANIRKPVLVGTCANPKIKDAFHTFKTNNAGGTPGRKMNCEKHSVKISVQILICENILNLETFANFQISFLEVQIVPAPRERFADFLLHWHKQIT